jgi:hypothetical protein
MSNSFMTSICNRSRVKYDEHFVKVLTMQLILIITALILAPAAQAADFRAEIVAQDEKGRPLDYARLLKHIAPNSQRRRGVTPERSGLFVTDLDGQPVPGRPWWVTSATAPTISWRGATQVRITLPWPVGKDGFSTIVVDNGGKGYKNGQKIFLNEDAAIKAYRGMQAALKIRRGAGWTPPYAPSDDVTDLVARAKEAIAEAKAQKSPRKRGKAFNQALTAASFAWQQVLYDYGRQRAQHKKYGPRLRFGLSIDESILERIDEHEKIVDRIKNSGANWVRLVFHNPPGDFTYSRDSSFAVYDSFIRLLGTRKIRIMGSVCDSMLWPKDLTAKLYQKRTKNLVMRYKDVIRSWEVASEPNADWLGGTRTPLGRKEVLLAVQKAVVQVKRIDSSLETVATLHWWEGTARDENYALFPWLDWAARRGFGKGVDVMAVSVYPHRHPLGLAFDRVFLELNRRFPDKKLMLGGFSFADGKKNDGYWWLTPRASKEARKDLLLLYMGVSAAVPNAIGGGFYWGTLKWMLPPGKRPGGLYRVHGKALERLKK